MTGTWSLVDTPALADHWYAVDRSVELTSAPRPVRLLGADYVIWRGADGRPVAAPDRCPHREAPLSYGRVVDGVLECPYHGWRFGSDGACVSIPSSGPGSSIPPRAGLGVLHVAERYGLVWLCPGQPVAGIPEIAHDTDPTFRRINTPVDVWRVSATRMTDNFLDISHFPFVHQGTFGIAQDTQVPHVEMDELDDGWFGYRYEVQVRNEDLGQRVTGLQAPVLTRTMTSGFTLPFSCRSTILYETGLEHILLLLSTPVEDDISLFTFVVWRNDDFAVSAEEIIRFDLAIGAEDKTMLEKVPGVLPLANTGTVSVQADRASVEWRRRLGQMVGG